ncbi:MAG: right-handed parallel beta-helix repeat-containing protein, partial [Actinomycetota bacterium]
MRPLIKAALAASVLATALVIVAAPAGAATIQVTNTLDETIDNGLTSLREAIELADGNGQDDTIVLPAAGFLIIDFCAAGPLEHAANENLTIDGNGAVVQQTCDGGSLFRHLGPDSELEITDLEMNTGLNSGDVPISGAAVFADHDLTLTNVTITGMDAGTGGSLVDNGNSDGLGDGTFTLTNVEITGNVGTALAPSFVALSVTGSTISDNTGNGIAAVDGTPVAVTNTTVADNGGVGIRTTGQSIGVLTVTGSTVRDNDDTGIACSNCSEVTVDDTDVLRNGADIPPTGFGGGGVRIDWQTDGFADQPLTATITGSTIDANVATQGGAGIDVFEGFPGIDPTGDRASLLVQDSSVTDNRPTGFFDLDGGGIRVRTGALTVIDSTITGNWAGLGTGATSANGGGIFFRDENQVLPEGSLLVQGSTISGNLADGSGGGIRAVAGTSVVIEDTTLDGNEAFGLSGGGVHVSGADTTVLRSTLSGNAAGVGGGLALDEFSGYPEGSLLVQESTVSGNTTDFAASGGGGVFVNVGDAGVNATFRNSTITDNTSANLGGGIMAMQTSSVTLEHVTLVDNSGATGANVFVAARDLVSASSVIADPAGGGENCSIGAPGTFVTSGGNVIDD